MATASVDTSNLISSLSSQLGSTMDEYKAFERGALLGNKYKFVKQIQTGSFGKVCLATDSSNHKYAIKSMKKSIPGVSNMARHEISVLRKLGKHPNICQLLDCFDTKKYIVLVLEFCDDGDLYDKVHHSHDEVMNHPMMVARMCSSLAKVVQYAHSLGVYHRDIKPENVLLMKTGEIKLCDWGLSTRQRNSTDFNVGTEKYMPPEAIQYNDTKGLTYDAKLADFWSFGITILFTLFGKCPFRKASYEKDANFAVFSEDPSVLLDYYPDMTRRTFTAIVNNLLCLEPRSRDLNKCIAQLDEASKIGFTYTQEYQIETLCNSSVEVSYEDDFMFEMEGNAVEQSKPCVSTMGPFDENVDSTSLVNCASEPIPISGSANMVPLSSLPPSLVHSVYTENSLQQSYNNELLNGGMSWFDADDTWVKRPANSGEPMKAEAHVTDYEYMKTVNGFDWY